MHEFLRKNKNAKTPSSARSTSSARRPPPWAMTSRRRACFLMKASVAHGSIAPRSSAWGI